MRRIYIIGGKNHGKTMLVAELVTELTRRGLRVGTNADNIDQRLGITAVRLAGQSTVHPAEMIAP